MCICTIQSKAQSKIETKEEITVIISEMDNNIYQTKSCFSDKYRFYKLNKSKINTQWVYEDEQYYGDDGCFTLITRGKPNEEDITAYLVENTSLLASQILFEYPTN